MNMKVYVTFLLNVWMKQKMNLFYEHEHKKNFFSHNIKFNLEPKS